ncbi:hypothetical protein D3C80_1317660 [compost metagenome]
MKSTVLAMICATYLLQAGAPAWAVCTEKDERVKGQQVAAKVASITQNDPARAREVNEQLAAMDKDRSSKERPDNCAAYDEMLKELEQTAPEVDRESSQQNDSGY